MRLRTFGTGVAVEGITLSKGEGGCSDAKGSLLKLLVSFRKPPPPPHAGCLDNTQITTLLIFRRERQGVGVR